MNQYFSRSFFCKLRRNFLYQSKPYMYMCVHMNGSWILVLSAVHDRSAFIFLLSRFSVSNEPAQFDGKHWSVAGEGEGGL